MPEPTVFLWEVSDVLANDRAAYRAALAGCAGQLLGNQQIRLPMTTLSTDPEDLEAVLDAADLPSTTRTELREQALPLLESELAARRAQLADAGRTAGSAEVMSQVKQRHPTSTFAPLTGRSAKNATLILDAVGLGRYFDLPAGTYGSDVRDRGDLLPAARVALCDKFGSRTVESLVLVTSNPIDARAAAASGVRVVGVSPDAQVGAQLRSLGAVATFTDLGDVGAAVSAMLD